MPPPKLKPSLYDEINKYADYPGINIFIDSDELNPASVQGKKVIYDEEKKQLIINGRNLSEKDEADLIKFLQEQQEEGVNILNTEQEDTINEYQSYSDSFNPYRDAIEVFSMRIPKKDLWTLKMSFYMKIRNERDEDIKDYRRQIKERFGLRGLYISNLCNEGYFEGEFKTAALKRADHTFKEYYELRVGFELAALFVHNGMTSRSLSALLQEKLELCSKYGIFEFKVHAKGTYNVGLVKSLFNEDGPLEDFGVDITSKITKEKTNGHPVFIEVVITIL